MCEIDIWDRSFLTSPEMPKTLFELFEQCEWLDFLDLLGLLDLLDLPSFTPSIWLTTCKPL
jgi:hypothetical protein